MRIRHVFFPIDVFLCIEYERRYVNDYLRIVRSIDKEQSLKRTSVSRALSNIIKPNSAEVNFT